MNGQAFQLEMGGTHNKALQEEWQTYGKEAFSLDVLQVVDADTADVKEALKTLKQEWLVRLHPYGERGYNPQTQR